MSNNTRTVINLIAFFTVMGSFAYAACSLVAK